MVLLKNYKSLRLIGIAENTIKMLQGQLTSDIYEVTETYSQLTAMCDEKGYVIADMFASKQNNDFLLTLHSSKVEKVAKELEKYLPFYKIKCEIDSKPVVGVVKNIVDRHCYFKNKQISFGLNFTDSSTGHGVDEREWKIMHWQQGIYFLQDFIDQNQRPQDVGFEEKRISFSKGCYRGQEIVARMHYLNKKKTQINLVSSLQQSKVKNNLTAPILYDDRFWYLQKTT
ncbi:MAG: hypothetical protein VW146_05560 [Gammaproteobacteria bacterium]